MSKLYNSSIAGNHFVDRVRDTLLRGGRVTKWKGLVACVAPVMGTVLAPLMLAGIITAGTSYSALAADECGVYAGPNGVIICDTTTYTTGPADDIVYTTGVDGIDLTLQDITVNDPTGHSVNVSTLAASTNAVDVSVDNVDIRSSALTRNGINIAHVGIDGAINFDMTSGFVSADFAGGGSAVGINFLCLVLVT